MNTPLRLTDEAVVLLNRLGNDPYFAWTRHAPGFYPTDKIECRPAVDPSPQGLGTYLDSLSGSSGGRGFSGFVTPASPVAAADPVSDEFNAGALDPSWTRLHTLDPLAPQRGTSPGVASGARESFTQREGWLLFQPTPDSSVAGYTKSLGTGDALTDAATIYTRFSMDSNALLGDSFGLILSKTTGDHTIDTDNHINLQLTRSSTDNTWTIEASKTIGGSGSNIYSTALTSFMQPVNGLAVASFLDEGNMNFFFSTNIDGGSWKMLGSFTVSAATFTPDRLTLIGSSSSTPAPIYGLDYVRRESGLYLVK